MNQNLARRHLRTAQPLPPIWLCQEELNPLWQVNTRLLEGLIARNGDEPLPCALPADVPEGLRDLGESGRQRLARIPCLLVDGGFQDAQHWWEARAALSDGTRMRVPVGWANTTTGKELAHATLHLAWYWSRSHADAVQRVLGASRSCAATLATLDLFSLSALADTYADSFGTRWEDRPHIWRSLIEHVHGEPNSPPFSLDIVGLRLFSEWILSGGEDGQVNLLSG